MWTYFSHLNLLSLTKAINKGYRGGFVRLGEKIRSLRRQQKITQERLAEMSGMTVNYLSKIERGSVSNISAEKLSKIAATLNVSMDELFNDNADNPSKTQNRPNQHILQVMLKKLPPEEAEKFCKFFIETIDTFQSK